MIEFVREIATQIWSTALTFRTTVRIWDVIDILIMTFIIYRVLRLMQRTSASSVIKGLVLIIIVAGISNFFNMNILSYLLSQALQMGVIILVILFQPEIRKMFETMGTTKLNTLFRRRGKYETIKEVLNQITSACYDMSKNEMGAIIVFERKVGLNDYATTGVAVNSNVSTELIQNIFYPNSPLHDGALIVREDKLIAASCMLPLSTNYALIKDLGMRHRAALGLCERSDAVVIVVSEQTGALSIATDGMLKRNLDHETFEKLLENEILSEYTTKSKSKKQKAKDSANVQG
ncbi:MAG: diadenylate cyclase CdaA [Oscillospiraceae bacterium]|nr:diadenylate cyclase CdaA [Oscillospiraceae bacterium]